MKIRNLGAIYREHSDNFPEKFDKDKRNEEIQGLLELKNSVAVGFILINVMWISAFYMLQAHTMQLGIKWPLAAKLVNITYNTADVRQIILHYTYLKVDVLGMFFAVGFIGLMLLQFGTMIIHRLITLEHIVATTPVLESLDECLKKVRKRKLSKGDTDKGVSKV